MAIDSYTSHRLFTLKNPVKARRYYASIEGTLRRHDIAAGERARLDEALRGIADGLHASNICRICGRSLRAGDSVERGEGPVCHAKAMAS